MGTIYDPNNSFFQSLGYDGTGNKFTDQGPFTLSATKNIILTPVKVVSNVQGLQWTHIDLSSIVSIDSA